jgi:glucose/arabinose dehydrogenase
MRPASHRRKAAIIIAAFATALLAAGCSTGQPSSGTTWVPQQDFQANTDPQPQLPGNGLEIPEPSTPTSPTPWPSSPGNSSPGTGPSATPSPSSGQDPAVVATKLNQPTGLVVLPDGTALVGERTTGRILRVQPVAGKPATLVQTLSGVDGSGDGGLLDLAISPTFDEDGLIYAYLTTATDNRVVHFAIGSAPSPVLVGIPKGRTDNAGRIAFDGTGAMLIGTGDAGNPALATSPKSFAGKILRTDDIGRPAADNPTTGSAIFARGFRTVDGLCVDPLTGLRVAISRSTPDEVNLIQAGRDYGWPKPGPGTIIPAATLPSSAAGGGGCALANGELAVATSTGRSAVGASIDQNGTIGTFTAALKDKYGRLRTVVAGSDGALWLTTSNRDGLGKPISSDDRVIRVSPSQIAVSSVL